MSEPRKIGVLTIGQAPRADDVVAELGQVLGPSYALLERGALDDLDPAEIERHGPEPGHYLLISLLRNGQSVRLSKQKILARLQAQIDAFGDDGVDAILLLCTGAFPEFKSDRLIVQPQEALYHLALGLAGKGARIGAMTPLADQLAQARAKWREYGVDPILAAASPYTTDDEVTLAARDLADRGADLILMDCMGYSLAMKARVKAAASGCPVILARSAIARVVAEVAD
ncbi:MAG TPA: AroM family protein [Candidatus Methylomirabilis sp.]|nr:AroM family protein [Candidatus Methylomirabilis sp.]